METADVIVIGGGVMGTSIAFNLARRRRGAGRAAREEHRLLRHVGEVVGHRPDPLHHAPDGQMALLARGIFERWADEVGGESGFVRTGMLFVGPPESRDRVERTLRMNQEVGIEAS